MEMCLVYAERCATEFCELGRGGNRDCVLAVPMADLMRELPVTLRIPAQSPSPLPGSDSQHHQQEHEDVCILVWDKLYGAHAGNAHLCDPAAMLRRRAQDTSSAPSIVPCDPGHIAVARDLGNGEFGIRCVPQPIIQITLPHAATTHERVNSYQ
jgi:hypothetical protein